MPIANIPLSKDQFEFLQQNITDQVTAATEVGTLALSGLHFVVLLQVDAPEVDLVNPFFAQLQRSEALNQASNWIPVVTSLNNHAILRGAPSTGSLSARLNAYLENGGNRILVTPEYFSLSAQAGYDIDTCYLQPGDAAGCLPGITSPLTASGNVGVFFSYTITAVGTLPITFGASGLPSWLTFDNVNTLSGTPPSSGVFSPTITATNTLGAASHVLTITVT